MLYRKILLFLSALGLATTALAGEARHTSLSIAVVDDATHDEVRVDLDDETLGFNLADMQVGENRAVVDKNGQNVLITREEQGYRFDVDGKTIRAPLHHGPHDGEYDVVVMGAPHAAHDGSAPLAPRPPLAPALKGTMILSARPIDAETQRAIEDLLRSAGHDSDVRFIDHSASGHGKHELRIVEKRVEQKVDATP